MLRQFSFEGILRVSSTYVWAAFKSHFIPIAVAVAFLHWIISLLFQVIMRAKCVSIILELNCYLRFEETKKIVVKRSEDFKSWMDENGCHMNRK